MNSSIVICSHEVCKHNCPQDVDRARVAFPCHEEGFIFSMASSSCVSCSGASSVSFCNLLAMTSLGSKWISKLSQLALGDSQMDSNLLAHMHFVHDAMLSTQRSMMRSSLSCHALELESLPSRRQQPVFTNPTLPQCMPILLHCSEELFVMRVQILRNVEQTRKSLGKSSVFVQKGFVLNILKIH